jgi:undecaprenyl-diphosphatase
VGAGIFELPEAVSGDNQYTVPETAVATVVAFFVGYASIAWLLRYVATKSYAPFVVYRIALGSVVLVLLSTGTLTP